MEGYSLRCKSKQHTFSLMNSDEIVVRAIDEAFSPWEQERLTEIVGLLKSHSLTWPNAQANDTCLLSVCVLFRHNGVLKAFLDNGVDLSSSQLVAGCAYPAVLAVETQNPVALEALMDAGAAWVPAVHTPTHRSLLDMAVVTNTPRSFLWILQHCPATVLVNRFPNAMLYATACGRLR